MKGRSESSKKRIATGPLARTKPSLRPLSKEVWLAFQAWLGTAPNWHGVSACTEKNFLPWASRLKVRGRPRKTGSPSTLRRRRNRWGTMPRTLSKDWFSIITTTMCSICGIVSVPSGRRG